MMLSLLACTGADPVDTTPVVDTVPDAITYPSQERVLIYDGHGGEPGSSLGVGSTDLVEAFVASEYGWQVDRRPSLGQPENFRLVLLMDPGVKDPVAFKEADIESLKAAMKTGTRVAVLTSQANCAGDTINPLLEGLGVAMRLSGGNHASALVADGVPGTQLTEGVERVYMSNPCLVEPNGGDVALFQERENFAVVERPLYAGDVVLIGDYGWMDDTDQLDLGDNRELLRRLVEVDPGLAR